MNRMGISTHTDEDSISNPILFEEGAWRLYGHLDDEYSTMAHKCLEWRKNSYRASGNEPPVWRWFWGPDVCDSCLKPIPEEIKGLHLLHNFDRIASNG